MTTTEAREPGRRPRRQVVLVAAGTALVALLVVAFLVLDPFVDGPTPARVGQVVTTGAWNSDDAPREDAEVTVALPPGDVVLRVGEPRDALPDVAGLEQGGVPAPDGGAFVPVRWEWGARSVRTDVGAQPDAPPGVGLDAAPAPELGLLVDGEVVALPIGTPGRGGLETWSFVATDGEAEQTWVVRYDGVEVRITGSSAGLEVGDAGSTAGYEDYVRDRSGEQPTTVLPVATTPASEPRGSSDAPLTMIVGGATREPYVTGLGWAPDGTTWVVLTLRIEGAFETQAGDVVYGLDDLRWRTFDEVTLTVGADGEELPAPTRSPYHLYEVYAPFVLAVVEVPTGVTTVTLDARATMPVRYAEPESAAAPDALELRWSGEVELR
ncbi:MAG TPA: hypothetical protein VGE77_07990 [Nocardioides sp.]